MSIDVDNMDNMDKPEVTDDDKLWALLGYILPIVAIIMLVMEDKKNRPFIKYHAIHGLMFGVLTAVLSATVCGWIISWAYGIYVGFQAYQGEWVVVPAMTDFAKNQGWIE